MLWPTDFLKGRMPISCCQLQMINCYMNRWEEMYGTDAERRILFPFCFLLYWEAKFEGLPINCFVKIMSVPEHLLYLVASDIIESWTSVIPIDALNISGNAYVLRDSPFLKVLKTLESKPLRPRVECVSCNMSTTTCTTITTTITSVHCIWTTRIMRCPCITYVEGD